jgi:hypothetical protein
VCVSDREESVCERERERERGRTCGGQGAGARERLVERRLVDGAATQPDAGLFARLAFVSPNRKAQRRLYHSTSYYPG